MKKSAKKRVKIGVGIILVLALVGVVYYFAVSQSFLARTYDYQKDLVFLSYDAKAYSTQSFEGFTKTTPTSSGSDIIITDIIINDITSNSLNLASSHSLSKETGWGALYSVHSYVEVPLGNKTIEKISFMVENSNSINCHDISYANSGYSLIQLNNVILWQSMASTTQQGQATTGSTSESAIVEITRIKDNEYQLSFNEQSRTIKIDAGQPTLYFYTFADSGGCNDWGHSSSQRIQISNFNVERGAEEEEEEDEEEGTKECVDNIGCVDVCGDKLPTCTENKCYCNEELYEEEEKTNYLYYLIPLVMIGLVIIILYNIFKRK